MESKCGRSRSRTKSEGYDDEGCHQSPSMHDNVVSCCYPSGPCLTGGLVDVTAHESVQMYCTYVGCDQSLWMHGECFEEFEKALVNHIKQSNGRTRSWSEKMIRQNLWNKKSFELIYKMNVCKCGVGHLTKDSATYTEVSESGGSRKSSKRRGSARKTAHPIQIRSAIGATPKQVSRLRNSLSASEVSSSAGSLDSLSPRSGGSRSGSWQNSPPSGGRLARRSDFLSLQSGVDPTRYHVYHIKVEEEFPADDTKSMLLQTLSSHKLNTMYCLVCGTRMLVYDKYPLMDGTAFISPVRHREDRSIPAKQPSSAKQMFVSCVCMKCMEGTGASCLCRFCRQKWLGCAFQIGAVYPFDIFAACPCCPERYSCGLCSGSLVSDSRPAPQSFTEFSAAFSCASCDQVDHHFVRPLTSLYHINLQMQSF